MMMADAPAPYARVTLRLPAKMMEQFDVLATALDQPRSSVMQRALAQYLEAEGNEIAQDIESLAEFDRGEGELFETVLAELRAIINHAATTQRH